MLKQSRDGLRTTYAADLDPGWTVGGRPNGGYLLAILGRAAGEVSAHPDVLAVSAHFLRPPAVGAAEAELEVLHEGRSVSTHRATLRQDGRTCAEALVTTGHLDETSAYWRGDTEIPAVAPLADCTRLIAVTEAFDVPLMDQLDLRLDPGSMGWTAGARPAAASTSAGSRSWTSRASTRCRCSSPSTRSPRPPSTSRYPAGCRRSSCRPTSGPGPLTVRSWSGTGCR